MPFLMIVAIRTGWNLQVILDLDPDRLVVAAPDQKGRGNHPFQ